MTKHAHVQSLLSTAKQRGFQPRMVACDRWYSSLENLKTMRGDDWHWRTRLTSNRQVNPDAQGNRAFQEVDSAPDGTVVHRKGYGMILVCRIATPDGDTEYGATSQVAIPPVEREQMAA